MKILKDKYKLKIFIVFVVLINCAGTYKEFYTSEEHTTENISSIKSSQSDIYVDSYFIPGISEPIPSNQIIKIGLLAESNHFRGVDAWKGLVMAAREVNEAGGIIINSNTYYVGLISEDTSGETALEAIEATERLINDHSPHFITGGMGDFVYDYLEIVMDNRIPFLTTFTFGNDLCQNVLDNYERYKYTFRISPLNISSLLTDYISYIIYLCSYLNITYGGPVDKVGILWYNDPFGFWKAFPEVAEFHLPDYGISVVENINYSSDVTAADFATYWNQFDAAGVQVVCTFMPDEHKYIGKLMGKQYQKVKPQCIAVNFGGVQEINTYWDIVEGTCQFDINYQGNYYTNKTPLTIPFYNSFVNEHGIEPTNTAPASYNVVKLLADTVQKTQSFDPDITVSALEEFNRTNPFMGVGGWTAFTNSHDQFLGYPFGYGLFCQWKYIDGYKEVLPGYYYPPSIATGSLRLPYWGINGLLTDPPQPPGDFSLSSTAGNPDYDGKFNLTWSASTGAENYSIYMYNENMTYISRKFDLIAFQNATSPYQISLKKGDYYFRAVSYNKSGETMSSNSIYVEIPGPDPFSLDSTAKEPKDKDGKFELTWTDSERALNYSIFMSRKEIIEINESHQILANQTALSPFPVKIRKNGDYYFTVVAYNEVGSTMSNNEYVFVKMPADISTLIILFTVLMSSFVGVTSIFVAKKFINREKKIGKIAKKPKLK